MKKTWEGINELLNRQRNRKQLSALQRPTNSGVTQNPAEITDIFNPYFASIGQRLARNISPPRKNFHGLIAWGQAANIHLNKVLILAHFTETWSTTNVFCE